jgi:hypothetical protein
MAKLTGPQDIPAEYLDNYRACLKEITPRDYTTKRYPYRLPRMQTKRGIPSLLQIYVRDIFKTCVDCFNAQPYTGGVTPPDWGPANRSYWYDQAEGSGLWYFDYFMQQTLDAYFGYTIPTWCKNLLSITNYVHSGLPDNNFAWWPTLNIANHLGVEERIFIELKKPMLHNVYAYVKSIFGDETTGHDLWYHVYRIDEPWDKTNLTWNNMPPLGAYFGSAHISWVLYQNWYKLPLLYPSERYCLVIWLKGAWGWTIYSMYADPDKKCFAVA